MSQKKIIPMLKMRPGLNFLSEQLKVVSLFQKWKLLTPKTEGRREKKDGLI